MQLGPGLTPGQAGQLRVKEMEQMAGFSTGRAPGKCLGLLTPSVTTNESSRNSRWPSSSRHTTESVIKAKSASLTLFRPSSLTGPNSLHPTLCSVDIWSYFKVGVRDRKDDTESNNLNSEWLSGEQYQLQKLLQSERSVSESCPFRPVLESQSVPAASSQ